jgi:hypothetical protein
MNQEPLLNRSQAAAYVGVRSESAIRAAEAKGLPSTRDASRQAWYSPAALDAWPWRNPRPSDATRAGVLRDAAEGDRSLQSLRAAAGRELAQWRRDVDRADALKEKVERENAAAAAAFKREHMDEDAARDCLFAGDRGCVARRKFRDLQRHHLLKEVRVPRGREVQGVWETATEVESFWPVVQGGPFFARAEVLGLRKETLELARERPELVGPVPAPTAPHIDAQTVRDVLTIFIGIAAEQNRRGPPSP